MRIKTLTTILIVSIPYFAFASDFLEPITDSFSTLEIQENFIEYPDEIFPDVKKENNYYLAIKYLKDHELINGYPDGLFRPDQEINRAEALKILTGAFEFEKYSTVERPLNSLQNQNEFNCDFPDVNEKDWFYSYVCQAFNQKVIEGYPDGTFKPEQTINKVEALKIAFLHTGLSTNPDNGETFSDIENNEWFADYAKTGKEKTFVIANYQDKLFPDQKLTRGEFSLLIYRIIKTVENKSEFGVSSYYSFGLAGANTSSGQPFDPYDFVGAHKFLPFDSKIKVTNIQNGKSVIITIVDRGPYVPGRIIDLSPAAFEQIESLGAGLTNVELTSLE